MNPDDIAKLRSEKPREFDALVANRLHGWIWWYVPQNRSDGVKLYWNTAPDDTGMEHWERCDPVEPSVSVAIHTYGYPNYATDPAADYATLPVVKTWPASRQLAWVNRLMDIVQDRMGRTTATWPAHVEPGDYSAAALALGLLASGLRPVEVGRG